MEFDKNKILTIVTANQAKVGQKGWFGFLPQSIQEEMNGGQEPSVLYKISLESLSPFTRESGFSWPLFYPAPEPSYEERQAQWVKENNVKGGTKVSNCEFHMMRETKGLRTINNNEGVVITIQREWICQKCGTRSWVNVPYIEVHNVKPNPVNCKYVRSV